MAEHDVGESRISRFLSALASPFRRRTTPQPQMPLYTTGIQEPVLAQGITLPALYAVTHENLILRTVTSKLNQEIFRRGYYWEKKFRVKCVECHDEFQHDVEKCSTCGGEVKEPDPNDIVYGKWLLNQENSMEQSFLQVLYEIERDLNIVDDAFLILIKEYYVDEETGEIQFYRVKEIIRGDPIFMRIIADKRGVRGGRYRICRLHRDQVAYPGQDNVCPVCGSDMVDAHYVNMAGSGKNQYFTKGEVLHISKYNPSKLYGKSPVNTLWRQAMTLTAMDNYMYTAYQKRRTPKGIISVTTDNLESMKSFWKGVDEKLERDPHYIPKVGIESQTGRGGVNWVKFMDTLEEMQYIAVRDEIRNRIAAFFGVSSIFMIDNGKSGGLNNEGLQILVTNRAVEFGQKVYTEVLFPRLLREMGISDWKITLYPNEEEDEITRLRRDEMEVNLAQRMQMLGYKPDLMEEGDRDIRFTYRKIDEQAQPQAQAQSQIPMRGNMPMNIPGARNAVPPGMGMGAIMPPSQPGGEGQGIRTPRSPARPQQRSSDGAGSPLSNVQQRGLLPTISQQNSQALMDSRRLRGA
tara:strand:- start:3426 stop:5156 length:1731 start_codon:yes stop_codon:yes gene_type:complete